MRPSRSPILTATLRDLMIAFAQRRKTLQAALAFVGWFRARAEAILTEAALLLLSVAKS